MKKYFLILVVMMSCFVASAQNHTLVKNMIVETACGECQFHMKGKGCELAVRIDNKRYFVDGTGIDDHGDAHSGDGFCNATRNAEVSGEIVNDRFVASSFKLLPVTAQKKKTSTN